MFVSLDEFIAGWWAGVCGLLVGHPADTIKVRQQVSKDLSAFQTFSLTVRHEGPRGLYKGMLFPLLSAGALNSVFFGVFGNVLQRTQKLQSADPQRRTCEGENVNKHWHYNIFLAGCAAGFAQFFIACPVDVIKIRLQTRNRREEVHRVSQCLRDIYRKNKLRGFYGGFSIMLCRDIPASGIYVLLYEHLMALSNVSWMGSYPVLGQLLAGGTAGTLSWVAIIPFDVVKSRIQADGAPSPKYRGVLDCVVKSYRAEGLAVFFRGLGMVCVRAFPVNAATFVGYEWCLKTLESLTHMVDTNV